MIQVFSKEWFEKHQKGLLRFANTGYGRKVLRIDGEKSAVEKRKIINIAPNFIEWKEGDLYYREFRTHDKFAKRLYYHFYPVWTILHGWDMRFANKLKPAWNLGFDTLTVYPDAGTGGTTVDGNAQRQAVDESFAVIRAGAGTNSSDTSTLENIAYLHGSTTNNQYKNLQRSIYTFDTSTLTGATISAATMSIYGSTAKNNDLGSNDLHIGGASPAADNAIVNADYQAIARVSFGSVAYAAWSIIAYNDFSLNASGLANVNQGGISRFSAQLQWDIDNDTTGLTWGSNVYTRYLGLYADQAGTDNDPKLVVTYEVGTPQECSEVISLVAGSTKGVDKSTTEAISISTSIIKTASKALSDGVSVVVGVYKILSSIFTEVLGLVDNLIRGRGAILNEVVTVTGSISKQVTHFVSEGLIIVGGVFKAVERSFAEGFLIVMNIVKGRTISLVESISLVASATTNKFRVWRKQDKPPTTFTDQSKPSTIWTKQ